jgi:hypothetical protein
MKNSHDSDTTAMPRSRAANGSNRMTLTTVNAVLPAASDSGDGGCRPIGHAARTSKAVIAVRTTINAAISIPKASHEEWKTSSQRRSWKTPNGAGADVCGANACASLAPATPSSSASTTGNPTARTMSRGYAASDAHPQAIVRSDGSTLRGVRIENPSLSCPSSLT